MDTTYSIEFVPAVIPAPTMRRVRDKMPWRVWLVAVIVFWERAAFWGITAPWRKSQMIQCKRKHTHLTLGSQKITWKTLHTILRMKSPVLWD